MESLVEKTKTQRQIQYIRQLISVERIASFIGVHRSQVWRIVGNKVGRFVRKKTAIKIDQLYRNTKRLLEEAEKLRDAFKK